MLRFLHIIFSVDSGIKKERKTCFINHLLSEWRLKVSFVIKRNLELKSSSSSLLPGNWRNSTISSAAVSAYYKSKYTHTKLKKKKKKNNSACHGGGCFFILFYFSSVPKMLHKISVLCDVQSQNAICSKYFYVQI